MNKLLKFKIKMKYNNTVIHTTTVSLSQLHSELLFTEAVGLEMAIRKYYI